MRESSGVEAENIMEEKSMDRDEIDPIDQVYFVKCNGKFFARFETNNGRPAPVLKDKPDADGMVVPMFRILDICDAKEICKICADKKNVDSPAGSDGHEVWEIVAANRVLVDDRNGDGIIHEFHTEFIEMGTIWSLEV